MEQQNSNQSSSVSSAPGPRRVTIFLDGEDRIGHAVRMCLRASAEFQVEPLPDDQWCLTLKNEGQPFLPALRDLARGGLPQQDPNDLPRINIQCEIGEKDALVKGTTYLEVESVRLEDDGSFTAITRDRPDSRRDLNPQSAQEPATDRRTRIDPLAG